MKRRMGWVVCLLAALAIAGGSASARPHGATATPAEPEIHTAALAGDAAAVTRLLESDPKNASVRDRDGFTPLHHARNAEVARLLIEKGAEVNARCKSNKCTPLHSAVFRGRLDVVKVLLEKGADIKATDAVSNPALHYAAGWNRDPEATRLLLDAGAPIDQRDNSGWTALHHAAYSGYDKVAALLISRGADINARDFYGQTPLGKALEMSNMALAKTLVESGARK